MPAKKSTTAVAAPAAPAAATQFATPQFSMPTNFGQYPQNFQFSAQMPNTQFGFSAPQYAQIPVAHPVPQAQAVAVPAPVVAGPSAIEMMEAQMKTMREYIANMEKTFKEAKKGMKKPKVPKDPNAPKNPVPEGTQAWNDFVVLVQKEESDKIRATDPTKGADWKGITRKEAMAKAKELKAAGDPRYNYVKKEKPVTTTAAADASSAGAEATEVKKRGRKPKTAAPALPVATNPTTAFSFPTFASTGTFGTALPTTTAAAAAEETLEVEEKSINGQTYLVTAKNECWHMLPNGDQGPWAGIYNGSIIVPTPEPSC
jgi:hypothetical protein